MPKQSMNLMRCAAYLLKQDPDMTLSRLNVFLNIARGKDVLVRDLVKTTGLGQSTIARTVALLSDKPLRGKREGLQWVTATPDPDDPRRVLLNLTKKGRVILSDLENLMD